MGGGRGGGGGIIAEDVVNGWLLFLRQMWT